MAARRLGCSGSAVTNTSTEGSERACLEPILVDCYPKLQAGLPEYLLLQFRTCVFLETESCCLAVPVLYPFTDLKTIIKSFFQPSPHSFRQQPFIRCLLCTRRCARPQGSKDDSARAPAPSIAFSPDAPTNCPLRDFAQCFTYTHSVLCQVSLGNTGLIRILYCRTFKAFHMLICHRICQEGLFA